MSEATKKAQELSLRERWSILPRLLQLIWRLSRKDMFLLLLLQIAQGLVPVVQITLLNNVINTAIGLIGGHTSLIVVLLWLGGLTVGQIGGTLLLWTKNLMGDYVQERLKARMQELLMRKAAGMSLERFQKPEFYDALARAQDGLDNQMFRTFSGMFSVPSNLVTVISLLIYVSLGSPLFPLILLAGSLVALFVRASIYRKRYHEYVQHTNTRRLLNHLEEMMKGRPIASEVRLFGLQEFFLQRRKDYYRTLRDMRMRWARAEIVNATATQGSQLIPFTIVMLGVILLISAGTLPLGQYAAYLGAIESFQDGLYTVVLIPSFLDANLRYIHDLFSYLDLPDEGQDRAAELAGHAALHLPAQVPTVAFEQVSFKYPGKGEYVLRELNLHIRPGERIALIGANGAGKSTLARLLLGLYQPTEGRITVEGVDLHEIAIQEWRTRCASVFQEYVKYQLTARENIAFGALEYLDAQEPVRVAASKSGADQVIEQLPQRYETLLGKAYDEAGQDLSGGQWQKLAIARAYLRDATVLVLDEPTAALDARAEVEVYRQFRDISQGRSALLISHRLGSAKLADRILVLNEGHIVEEGTHETLLARGGLYANMLGLQAQWYV